MSMYSCKLMFNTYCSESLRWDPPSWLQGEFGPFRPNTECQVPLWLAITLWKRKKCTVRAPEWMDPIYLSNVLEEERSDPAAFQPLPFHHIEIAHCLFTAGIDEALPQEVFGENLPQVKELVHLVQKARMSKILSGLGQLNGPVTVKLNNLGSMEINTVRTFFGGSLDMFYKVSQMEGHSLRVDSTQGFASQPVQQQRRQLRGSR